MANLSNSHKRFLKKVSARARQILIDGDNLGYFSPELLSIEDLDTSDLHQLCIRRVAAISSLATKITRDLISSPEDLARLQLLSRIGKVAQSFRGRTI